MPSDAPSDAPVHVVDDDLAVRQALAFLLASDGLTVRVHESASAYLAAGTTPLWNSRAGNFAPRAGVAWKPFAQRSFVIRAGGGVYYDLGYGVLMSSLSSSPPNYTSRTVNDISIFDPLVNFKLPQGGLEPPTNTQAQPCPTGTMATLALGHNNVVRCLPL